jgi:hypothetical protein
MKVILSDNVLDFKSRFLIPDAYTQLNLPFAKLLTFLISGKEVYCFHFRYLHLKGVIKPVIRYGIICLLLKVRRIPIIWSMHNLSEHSADRAILILLNRILRAFLFNQAKSIIVFHDSVKRKLPEKVRQKTKVSNFGSVKAVLNSKEGEEKHFFERYKQWQGYKKIDILVVSIAKKNDYSEYIRKIDGQYNILIINKYDEKEYKKRNIFKFDDFLYKGLDKVIKENQRELIGLIFHRNMSVATSFYMYSDYGIPLITNDLTPNQEIILESGMGLKIRKSDDINKAIKLIKDNYGSFSMSSKKFNEQNNWEKGRETYGKVLENINS